MRIAFLIFCIILFMRCANSHEQLRKDLVARWEMERVFDNGQEVTSEHNPKGNRWIEFKSDGSFESGGDPYGNNTGTYSLNYELKSLYIDSDVGDDDDSQWIIEIEGDKMTWEGTGAEWAERFKLVHRRGE